MGLLSHLIVWPIKEGVGVQVLDSLEPGFVTSDRSVESALIMYDEAYRAGNRLVRAGSGNGGGNWSWAMVRIYELAGGRWHQIVTKPKNVEDEPVDRGYAHFLRRSGRVDPNVVVTELQVCPEHVGLSVWLNYRQTWVIRGNQIEVRARRLIPTPLSELDRIAALAQSGNQSAFNLAVPKNARAKLWKLLKRMISVTSVGDYDFERRNSIALHFDRRYQGGDIGTGSQDFTLQFSKVQGKWRLMRVKRA